MTMEPSGVRPDEAAGPSRPSAFISYSRQDREHASRLSDILKRKGVRVFRDSEDILPTEAWKTRIAQLITEADAVVFLLSPRSVRSEICRWEVELACRLQKKLAPLVIEDVNGVDIPGELSRLNYIFATERDRFENAADSLCDAISVDADWIREHTRLCVLAARWVSQSRSHDLLLSGQELLAADKWLAQKPAQVPGIFEGCVDLITASHLRQASQRQYAELRLSALTGYVSPLLKERVSNLEQKATAVEQKAIQETFMRTHATAHILRAEIDVIANFLDPEGRWHPQPAEHVRTCGAQEDYIDVFEFPCCNKIVTAENSPPHQYRSDGCREKP